MVNNPNLNVFNLVMLCLKNHKTFDNYGYDISQFDKTQLIEIINVAMKSHNMVDVEFQTAKEQIETLEQVLSDNDIEY